MKHIWSAVFVAIFCAVLLAQESGREPALLKARIVQLEAQLVQVEAARAVCEARVNQSQSVQVKPVIEKEAGCVIDWASIPPKCKEP